MTDSIETDLIARIAEHEASKEIHRAKWLTAYAPTGDVKGAQLALINLADLDESIERLRRTLAIHQGLRKQNASHPDLVAHFPLPAPAKEARATRNRQPQNSPLEGQPLQ